MAHRGRSGNLHATPRRGAWLGSPLRQELRPVTLAANVTAGLTIGWLTVIVSVSLATLLFGGRLSPFHSNGIGVALIGSAIVGLAVALLGSLPGGVGQIQSAPVAVLVGASYGVVSSMPGTAQPIAGFMTVLALVALSTLVTGAVFLSLGMLRLGRLVRYVPSPVVGGFMAGTGWLLLSGGVGVMSGVRPSLASWQALFAPNILFHWLPGIAFGVVAVVVTRARRHFLAWPSLILGAAFLFYVALVLSGSSLADWRSEGLLLGPFSHAPLYLPFTVSDIPQVQWSIVAHNLPTVATVAFLSVMELLFNATGMELGSGRKVDLDRELRAAGLGNLVAAWFGGNAGYQGLSYTMLSLRIGTGSRIAALSAVLVVVATLVFGVSLLAYVPTMVVGGLLCYLGLMFLLEWVIEARNKLSRFEYAIVLAILVVIAAVGFLPGIGFGLVLAVLLFVISYSRVDAVRHALSSRNQRSRVRRGPRESELLAARGDAVLILQLQGFLFFGTANGVVTRVERRLEASPPLECLLLDFRRVTGVDATAIASFTRLIRLARSERFAVGLAHVPPTLVNLLDLSATGGDDAPPAAVFADLDGALEWSEERSLQRVIGAAPPAGSQGPAAAVDATAAIGPEPALPHFRDAASGPGLREFSSHGFEPARLLPYLERLDLPAGHRFIRQGDAADAVYFIASGQVTARLEQDGVLTTRLETMRAGSLAGELGFYSGGTRSASVVADVPSTVYRMDHASQERLTREEPELAAGLHELIARLTAERVVHLMSVVEELQR